MEIQDLLSGQDRSAKKFREHIWKYNNALAMTSLGCNVDERVNYKWCRSLCVQGPWQA